jgi:hypothetical protein
MKQCKECKVKEDKKGILLHKKNCQTYKKERDKLLKISVEV